MKFGAYNKLHFYSHLSETTWCLIGFHGNDSQLNDATDGLYLGFFLYFQVLLQFEFLYFKMTRNNNNNSNSNNNNKSLIALKKCAYHEEILRITIEY